MYLEMRAHLEALLAHPYRRTIRDTLTGRSFSVGGAETDGVYRA